MVSASEAGPPLFVRREDPSSRRLIEGLAASVSLHLAVVGLAWAASALGWLFASSHPLAPSKVDLVSVSRSDWDRHRILGTPPPSPSHPAKPEVEKPKVEAKPTPLPKGQIVDVAPGNDQLPTEAKYLAEHDNRVAKQTRAREQTPNYVKAAPKAITEKPLAPNTKTEPNHSPIATGTQSIAGGSAHPAVDAAKAVAAVERHQADALLPVPNGDIYTPKESQRVVGSTARQAQAGESHAPQPTPGPEGTRPALLTPSVADLGTMTGAAANDDLSDVDVSDGTFLNTRAFKYAGFFNRVKQRVGEQWNPNSIIGRRDPNGRLVGGTNRITVLDIVLDDRGNLRGVSVAKSCGLDFLDEEAVAAFERAAPFLNVPPGLLDENNLMRFQFGFHIEDMLAHGPVRFRTSR